MKFNRLRVLGFKSFVEPCEFVIERGLTAVVGPNGCGKSNLVEALRWVMGESSYKNMRASGMDDVIFSGSATRPPRNTAEVTLFLDNSDRTAPSGFNDADELQVSRRIEREAGSVYRINGKEARAKDVQILFADQSTGARSPSMVGQGRVGELIQAKPQARRALLEEAAGISGLHSRRHEAELRLRAAEQNLERLDDVVGELQAQIENLRRQARQATRFKNLSAEIRQAEAILLHLRFTQAREHEVEAKSALSAATTEVGDRAAEQMNAAKEQAVAAHKLPEFREAEVAAAAALQRLTIAKGQLEEEAARLAERRAELNKRLIQLDADIERENRIIADNEEVLARLDEEERTLNAEQAGAADREIEAKAAFEAATGKLSASEAELSALTARQAEAAALRSQFERALREASERRDRADGRLAACEAELAEIVQRLAALPDPAEKRVAVEAAERAVEAAEAQAGAAEVSVAAARAAEGAARGPAEAARGELARLETEASTLAGVLGAGTGDLFPAVLEQLRVEPGYESALGAALGEDLDVPLDANAPVHWAGAEAAPDDPALPEGIRPLAERVRAPDQLARRLAQIGVVEAGEGAALQPTLKPGQRLVSLDGALWRWDGYRASAEAPTAAAQRLAQKNRLAELDGQVARARDKAAAAEAELARADATTRAALDAEREAREGARQARAMLGEAREALSRAEKASGDLAGRRAALEESRAGLAEAREEAVAAITAAEAGLASAPDPAALRDELDRQTGIVTADRAAFAEARAAHDGLARDAAARQRRLEAIAADRVRWVARAASAEEHVGSLRARREETAGEAAGLEDAPSEIELRRRALLGELSRAEALRAAAADRLQEAETKQRECDKAAADALQALSSAREVRARAEERVTSADERRREVEARIREALNVAPHQVAEQAGVDPDAQMPEIADIERRLERLRIERERLGAVNLRAEEEQRELSERLETIVSEREDIIEAISKLRQAIQSLNREGRERLLAAFEVVNGHFQRLFVHLFGGGTAQLQLIESDDPLEAGLEILARPPGKRPQTMTLLSGGEQALTALALIFAVFLTNPAPICVLDEVDAPLDDHNVERFCNLMDEMARTTETRFVIITHNPITMSRVNRLFGVTMSEQGVSQLVSVDLQTAESMREAS